MKKLSYSIIEKTCTGVSMAPLIRDTSILRILCFPQEPYVPGDIVVFIQNRKTMAHRVVRRLYTNGVVSYITKGDANWTIDAPIVESNCIGKVIQIVNGNHIVDLRALPYRMLSFYYVCLNYVQRLNFKISSPQWSGKH